MIYHAINFVLFFIVLFLLLPGMVFFALSKRGAIFQNRIHKMTRIVGSQHNFRGDTRSFPS